jgi:acyl carrier protein
VVDSANFIDDFDADDLSVEMIMNFGQEFGRDISDDDFEVILTIGDAIKFKFLEKNASILATDA